VPYRFNGPFPGLFPTAGLAIGKGKGLYGATTNYVFQLRPPAVEGDAWTESAVYTFPGSCGGGGCEWYPLNAALAIGTNGTLFGATVGGGLPDCNYYLGYCGTAFALTPPTQAGGAWNATYLHAFKGGGGEGSNPEAGLAIGADGVLYGTTLYGGSATATIRACPTDAAWCSS
jgi:hypothetical protein